MKYLQFLHVNTFTVDTGGSASSGSTTGGGGSVTAAMEIDVGLNTTVLGNGWGAGTWGRLTWSSGAGSLAGQNLRLWMSDSWGEDLVANIVDGSLYYWDATNGKTTRMVELSTVSGASDVPTTVQKLWFLIQTGMSCVLVPIQWVVLRLIHFLFVGLAKKV